MRKLFPLVLFAMIAACATHNQEAQRPGSSASSNDPSASAGAAAGSSKETGDTQARHDQNPADKAPGRSIY
jgi:hypothetical protein